MNESTFQSLFRRTIGEAEVPADLSTQARLALRQSLETQPRRLREGLALLAAVVAVVAVVATLLAPRVFTHFQQPAGPSSPLPSAVATSPSPDPNACRLPIVVEDDTTPRGSAPKITAGFIDVASGQFSADTSTSPGLPGNPGGRQKLVYDPVVKLWLPSYVVAPDQLSYAYVTESSSGSKPVAFELHIYDLVQHQDRIVWTLSVGIGPSRWRSDGIYASSGPYANGNFRHWRIDSASGHATEIDEATWNPYKSLISGLGSYGLYGDVEDGLYTIGGRDAGTRYTNFVIIDGKRTDIYSGVHGDRMDFDPVNVWHDGPRLWFSNYDSKYFWSWTAATGLIRHSVHNIPNGPGSALHPVVYTIAGPCS
jgi:hypothetical protein